MRFAVAFDLRDFGDGLTRSATAGILRGHRTAIGSYQFKHQAVGQVAVVRNREHFAARHLFIIVHIVPQLADWRIALAGIIRQDSIRPALAVAEHDDTVQIVAAGHQCIFKPHEGCELARFIIAFDERAVACPDACRRLALSFGVGQRSRKVVAADAVDEFRRDALHTLRPFMHGVMPAPQSWVANEKSGRVVQSLGRAKAARMVGNHKEIEWPLKLCLQPSG